MNLKPDEMVCVVCNHIMSTAEIIPICHCIRGLTEAQGQEIFDLYELGRTRQIAALAKKLGLRE